MTRSLSPGYSQLLVPCYWLERKLQEDQALAARGKQIEAAGQGPGFQAEPPTLQVAASESLAMTQEAQSLTICRDWQRREDDLKRVQNHKEKAHGVRPVRAKGRQFFFQASD